MLYRYGYSLQLGLYSKGQPLSLSLGFERVFLEVKQKGNDYTIKEI